MNTKNRKTLEAIFSEPVAKSLEWMEIESLLFAVGVERKEKPGSRVRYVKDGLAITLHRPHPGKEAKSYQIKDIRRFLESIGVTP